MDRTAAEHLTQPVLGTLWVWRGMQCVLTVRITASAEGANPRDAQSFCQPLATGWSAIVVRHT